MKWNSENSFLAKMLSAACSPLIKHKPSPCDNFFLHLLAVVLALAAGVALVANNRITAQTASGVPVYLDSKVPIEVRVRDLMSRMTLKEKVGQLNLPCVY